MADISGGKGQCLCGATGLQADTIAKNVHACHCTMCRKWGGAALLAVDCGTEVELQGEKDITIYDSSQWAERGFCSKCGTHLFYRLKESRQYIVPVGLLDVNEGDLVFEHEIFIDEKPPYYHFGNDTKTLTGAEVFAKYAPD